MTEPPGTVAIHPTAASDVREWLRTNRPDYGVGEKGRLRDEWVAEYAQAQAAGVTADDFPADPGLSEPAPPPAAEVQPRKPGRGSWRSWFGRDKTSDGKPKARARTRGPRVPLGRLTERVWHQLAEAAPVLPLERLLYLQSPFAGDIAEDALAGTVVDRWVQPLAQAEEKAEMLGGLLGPPLFLMAAMATAPGPNEQPSMRHQVALGGLKVSLTSMLDVMGDRYEEAMQRAAEAKERSNQVEELMAWLLEPPPRPAKGANGQAPPPPDAQAEADSKVRQLFGGPSGNAQ